MTRTGETTGGRGPVVSGILKPLKEETFRRGVGTFAGAMQISQKGPRTVNNPSSSLPSLPSTKPGIRESIDGIHIHQPSGGGRRVEKTECRSGRPKRRYGIQRKRINTP